ncbi:hypothetical protein HKBW3C_02918 [Candidatus Hakubella thermalkaliphila]|nr:hypothetical protein HKBW3C_02918 [Candidatus Hakubella thermalkaliphila]
MSIFAEVLILLLKRNMEPLGQINIKILGGAMEKWITVMSAIKLAEGSSSKNKLGNNSPLLIKSGEAIYALLNQCPNLGCAMHNGELSGFILKCPCHNWLFDIRNG